MSLPKKSSILFLSVFIAGCSSMKPEQNSANIREIPVLKRAAVEEVANDKIRVAVIPDTQINKVTHAKYIVAIRSANNSISNAMVKGFSKFVENDYTGLSQSTKMVKEMLTKHGKTGLQLDVYGDLAASNVINALNSLVKDQKNQGAFSQTSITFYDTVYEKNKADQLLASLQGRQSDQNNELGLKVILISETQV